MTATAPELDHPDQHDTPWPVRVLALDLSLTATGIAHPNGNLTTYSPGGASLGDHRLAMIRDFVRGLVAGHDPTIVAIEGPVTRSHAATALGMVHGAVRTLLIDLDLPYLIVTPATLKLYATGKGGGAGTDKASMRMALYKRTGVDEPDDNRVDAAWLRLLALDLAGQPEVVMPQHNRTALDKVDMPGGAS